MFKFRFFMIVILGAVSLWAGETTRTFIRPTQDNVQIFSYKSHSESDHPLFTASKEDRLILITSEKGYYKVKNVDGLIGWISKNFATEMQVTNKFSFEDADIMGYIDNPEPVYILDADDPNAEKIHLDRSFKSDLEDHTDRNTFEREEREK
jgi:hypothetical protein